MKIIDSWGFAFMTYLIFSLRTNAVFAGIFFLAGVAVWVLAGAYFKVADGDYAMAGNLQIVRITADGCLKVRFR